MESIGFIGLLVLLGVQLSLQLQMISTWPPHPLNLASRRAIQRSPRTIQVDPLPHDAGLSPGDSLFPVCVSGKSPVSKDKTVCEAQLARWLLPSFQSHPFASWQKDVRFQENQQLRDALDEAKIMRKALEQAHRAE